MKKAVMAVAIPLLLTGALLAGPRGHHKSVGRAKTVYVDSYTKKNGTTVKS